MAHEPDGVIDYGATPITSFGTGSGDQNINGLLYGTKWTDAALTFSFPSVFAGDYGASYPNYSTHSSSFSSFSAQQETAANEWLDQYAAVSGLSFVELDGAPGALDEDQEATIRFANSDDPSTAYGYYPNSGETGGDMWFNGSGDFPDLGDYDYHTIGHEIGHALGLSHGHQGSGSFGTMNSNRDSMEFSIMTYRSYVGDPLSGGYSNAFDSYAQSLMMYDIAAIQFLYGANFSTNSGTTTYTFSTTTGEMSINGVGQGTPIGNKIFRTIWDGNGTDTYDFSNYSTDMAVDLRPGYWTDLDTDGNAQRANLGDGNYSRGHVFNALQYNGSTASLIERAYAGSGDDVLTGNDVANYLYGEAGNDTLYGGGGYDYLYGGEDNDRFYAGADGGAMYGGAGDDTATFYGSYDSEDFYGGADNDRVYNYGGLNEFDDIYAGSGTDSVYFYGADALTVDLAAGTVNNRYGGFTTALSLVSVENVTGSSYSDMIYGSAGANVIYGGGGYDYLYGLGGNDVLAAGSEGGVASGGAGNDTIYMYGSFDSEDGYGGDGNDTFNVYSGINENDDIYGGADTDTVAFYGVSTALAIDMATGDLNLGYGGFAAPLDFLSIERVYSGSGADVITGTAAGDVIAGNNGNDWLYGADGLDTLYGGDGVDYIYAGSTASGDLVYGGSGGDAIYSSGSGRYYAGDDNDVIYAGTGGAETLDGGTGNDWLYTSNFAGNFSVNLVTGATNFAGDSFVNFENLVTGAGNDILTGTGGDNSLYSGSGNDVVYGGTGDDYISTGSGNDTVYSGAHSSAGNIVYGGAGEDVIHSSGAGSYYAGDDNDTVVAGLGSSETLNGGNGVDTLDLTLFSGDYEVDLLTGLTNWTGELFEAFENVVTGVGNDTVFGTGGDNTILTNAGRDTIYGAGGQDDIDSGAEDDEVYGGGARDTIELGDGDDTAYGGDNGDWIFGGAGVDLIEGDGGTDEIYGGDDADALYGGGGQDFIYGGSRADVIDGGGGNDMLYGGAGNDRFMASTGDDYIDGGDKFGIYDATTFNGYAAGVEVDLLAGTATTSDGSVDTLLNIKRVVGTEQDDVISGADVAEAFYGGKGEDTLYGGGANDKLVAGGQSDLVFGGRGGDTVDGQNGDDVLFGDQGTDVMIGGSGDDTMTGGAGDDLFVFETGFGHDVITDFVAGAGTHDVLDFSALGITSGDIGTASLYGGSATRILIAGMTDDIILEGVTAGSLHADDFIV